MAERAKLVRLYGPDLLSEEEKAAIGLMRMLSYQHRIDSSQLNATTISLRNASIVVPQDGSLMQAPIVEGGHEEKDKEGDDVYLPPFAHHLLERLRLLTSSDGKLGSDE
jgi:hypothetical protein